MITKLILYFWSQCNEKKLSFTWCLSYAITMDYDVLICYCRECHHVRYLKWFLNYWTLISTFIITMRDYCQEKKINCGLLFIINNHNGMQCLSVLYLLYRIPLGNKFQLIFAYWCQFKEISAMKRKSFIHSCLSWAIIWKILC